MVKTLFYALNPVWLCSGERVVSIERFMHCYILSLRNNQTARTSGKGDRERFSTVDIFW